MDKDKGFYNYQSCGRSLPLIMVAGVPIRPIGGNYRVPHDLHDDFLARPKVKQMLASEELTLRCFEPDKLAAPEWQTPASKPEPEVEEEPEDEPEPAPESSFRSGYADYGRMEVERQHSNDIDERG